MNPTKPDILKSKLDSLTRENERLRLIVECQAKFALSIRHSFESHQRELQAIQSGEITDSLDLLPPGMREDARRRREDKKDGAH